MNLRISVIFALACLIAVLAIRPAEAEGTWKAGSAAVNITPDGPAWMAGYASRTEPSTGVELDLFAKTLVVQDPTGQTVVLVTLDLISVPDPLRKQIEKSLAESRNLLPKNLVMNCSHTHCGPEIRTTGTALDGLTPERRAKAIAYVETLQKRILSCIDAAFEKLAPATLSFQKARAAFAMNRRLPTATGYRNSPNPDGRVDHDVPVLRVEDADEKITAVVFGYACHNTTLGFQKLCGDYAGYAQQAIEDAHPGTVALFMMGCGGDQNPYPRRTLDLAKQHGRTLATAVEAALSTPKREIAGKLSLAFGTATLDYAEAPTKDQLEEQLKSTNRYDRRYAERLLKELAAGRLLKNYPAPVSVVRFGDAVLFVALPGETVVDYSIRIKREQRKANGPEIWVAGYSNDVFAYIPSLRVLLEGGYEAGGAMRYMTTVVQPGPFAPNVEDRLMDGVNQLIGETVLDDIGEGKIDNEYYRVMMGGAPFPEGEEKQAIATAFDKLFDTMRGHELPARTAEKYSLREAIVTSIERYAKKFDASKHPRDKDGKFTSVAVQALVTLNRSRGSNDAKMLASKFKNTTLTNRDSGIKATVSSASLSKMLHGTSWKKSVSVPAHMEAVGNLAALFQHAIHRESRPPREDSNSIAAFHHFDVPMPFDGEILRVKILAKEYLQKNEGARLYDLTAVEIERETRVFRVALSSNESTQVPSPPAGLSDKFDRLLAAVKRELSETDETTASTDEARTKPSLRIRYENSLCLCRDDADQHTFRRCPSVSYGGS